MSNTSKSLLSREKILDKALAMADEQGLDALSMRKLADQLGVKAMSLYNHVANKDDLIDGLVERVMEDIPVPNPHKPWKQEMRLRGLNAHKVLMSHPWVNVPLVSRVNAGPVMLSYVNATIGCLLNAGFSIPTSDYAWNAMDNYIYGFSLQKINFPFKEGEYAQVAAEYLADFPQEQWPYLYAMTEQVALGKHDGINEFEFEFGFEFILDGLEALLLKASNPNT